MSHSDASSKSLPSRYAEREVSDLLGDRVQRALVARVARGDLHAGVLRDARAGASDRADRARLVPGDEARADVDRGGLLDATIAADRELRRAAADVDVEHERRRGVARERDRAGAVRGEKALEVMAGRRAHELAGLAAEELDDRRRVLLARRFAGRDDGAGVDVVGRPAGLGVRALDELRDRVGVDAALRRVRRRASRPSDATTLRSTTTYALERRMP